MLWKSYFGGREWTVDIGFRSRGAMFAIKLPSKRRRKKIKKLRRFSWSQRQRRVDFEIPKPK
jgi:hypothetical protein